MKPLLVTLTAAAIAALASNGFAQDSPQRQINGTVVRGNTTIVFEAANANTGDLPMGLLRQWNSFSQDHPNIERQLAYHPRLIDDSGYLNKHPELGQLFNQNPDLLAAMRENPGNFAAIQPRPGE